MSWRPDAVIGTTMYTFSRMTGDEMFQGLVVTPNSPEAKNYYSETRYLKFTFFLRSLRC